MSLSGGPSAVAATANKMGIQTSLATTNHVKYSVGGGPFEPYNPALILGGLEAGVSPLEMAHAYQTIQHNGQILSGTMADSSDGPIGIQKVQDPNGELVQTNSGDPGQDKVQTKQVVPPGVAATARTILHTVVTSGTGRNAYTGDPSEWGKTGTTENNGDAWFVGADKNITVAIWVGHANSVKPMLTEYGGAPVDGGTIPALIFNEIVSAYDQLSASGRHPKGGSVTTTTTPTLSAPTAPSSTPAPSTSAPAPSQSAPSTQQPSQAQPSQPASPPASSGGSPSGGAPSTGGVSG
jgi:penicillin-binding protein 1A